MMEREKTEVGSEKGAKRRETLRATVRKAREI